MPPVKKWALRISLGLLVILVGAAAVGYRQLQPGANTGAGYVAHQVCSCIFVAERSYESCLTDMLPIMEPIQSEVVKSQGKNGVHAWIPALADRMALHTPGLGCSLD